MEEEDEREPRINELLLLQLLEKLADPQAGVPLWQDQLSTLFPRHDADLSTLPAWVCQSDDVFMQVEALLSAIESNHPSLPVKEISKRLPLIIRYNILSVETCSELLSYPGPEGHANLSGVALYHQPSFFNHSRTPVVSRWAVGDVMCFVANQAVPAGHELCISYIEHDVLCEPALRRNALLAMDFVVTDNDDDQEETNENNNGGQDQQQQQQHPTEVVTAPQQEEGPELPVVDSHVQNELMSMDPFERLSAIDELMQQARGEKLPDGEEPAAAQDAEMQGSQEGSEMGMADDEFDQNNINIQQQQQQQQQLQPAAWFQCDVQNLRIIKAITLDGLGQTAEALQLWKEAVDFCIQKLPPADESLVVVAAQAALCSWHLAALANNDASNSNNDYESEARRYAALALDTHHLLFGGGVARFRRRLDRDLKLPLRPSRDGSGDPQQHASAPADALWPIVP